MFNDKIIYGFVNEGKNIVGPAISYVRDKFIVGLAKGNEVWKTKLYESDKETIIGNDMRIYGNRMHDLTWAV